MNDYTIHNGHTHSREVWAVYYLPNDPTITAPAVLWTMAVPIDKSAPCRYCQRAGLQGSCLGTKAHAYAEHARLSTLLSMSPLDVDKFDLPPHVSLEMCAGNLFGQIMRRAKRNGPSSAGEPDGAM